MRRFFTIFLAIFLAGCAVKSKTKPQALNFTMISPSLKISDAGFLYSYKNSTKLQVYSSGVSLLEVSIKDRVCYNGVCKDELKFNEDFFKSSYYRGFFADILDGKPLFSSKNLVKTECGFRQEFSNLSYEICDKSITFKDKNVKIKIRKLD